MLSSFLLSLPLRCVLIQYYWTNECDWKGAGWYCHWITESKLEPNLVNLQLRRTAALWNIILVTSWFLWKFLFLFVNPDFFLLFLFLFSRTAKRMSSCLILCLFFFFRRLSALDNDVHQNHPRTIFGHNEVQVQVQWVA